MYKIAIDGPGGAGKSSVAKAVAKSLGIVYVDTGALYRTIGLFMVKNGVDTKDSAAVTSRLSDFTLELKFVDGKQVILLDGEDVGDTIRTQQISMAASNVSAHSEVRKFLLETQRNIAKTNCVIMDGRDIGTVIFPEAEVKIFLTASSEARARRRYDELVTKGVPANYEDVLREMIERDTNDSTRAIAPCVPAKDSIVLDNSDLTAEETTEAVIKIITEKIPGIKNLPSDDTFYPKAHRRFAKFFRWFFKLKVEGVENVPESGGIIICSNHISARDPIVIAAACKREIKFVAKKELFSTPIIGRIIKSFGAIPLNRSGSDVSAIRTTINHTKVGYATSIFPQGHRYPGVNPKGTPTKNGAAMVAHHAMCDVVPVCIKLKKFKYGIFRRPTVIFGSPIKYEELGLSEAGASGYSAATEIIFERILELGGYDKLHSDYVEK